mmetsp:Transcript_2914/g.11109  ORF Transcript_2914/g.11109 Transcript_2914/m.11109 type:complete len:207 (+) Transcript_2914:3045-3665(+)
MFHIVLRNCWLLRLFIWNNDPILGRSVLLSGCLPTLNKVSLQIQHWCSQHFALEVMPRHARNSEAVLMFIKVNGLVVMSVTSHWIAIVQAREFNFVLVHQIEFRSIVATDCQINTSTVSNGPVNDHHLLVVSPKIENVQFVPEGVLWISDDMNILIASFEYRLDSRRIQASNLAVAPHQNVYLDICLCAFQKDLIEAVLWSLKCSC